MCAHECCSLRDLKGNWKGEQERRGEERRERCKEASCHCSGIM